MGRDLDARGRCPRRRRDERGLPEIWPGRCRSGRVLSAATGAACGTMRACRACRGQLALPAQLLPLDFGRSPVTADYTSQSSPRVLKARLVEHSCQLCQRAPRNDGEKGRRQLFNNSLRFSAAQRPSAPYKPRAALPSSRKQRPTPAPPQPRPKTHRGQEGRKRDNVQDEPLHAMVLV